MAILSADLIERLRDENSPETRRDTVVLVAAEFAGPDLTESGRELAESIFRLLLKDADTGVRKALSESLKDNPNMPPDIAVTLAHDVADVAVPILRASIVFSESELVEIVSKQAEAWQQAVAARAIVTEPVSDALVDYGSGRVVNTLVHNPGAEIADNTTVKVIDNFANSEAVMGGLAKRPSLPPALAERLIAVVSENVRQQLAERDDLPPGVADQLALHGREAATLDLLVSADQQAELEILVRHLHGRDRLTTTLILRALLKGDLGFFRAALAARAAIPMDDAGTLLDDQGTLGIDNLCRAAELPPEFAEIVRVARAVLEDVADLQGAEARMAYQRLLTEQFREQYPELGPGNVDALLVRLNPLYEA